MFQVLRYKGLPKIYPLGQLPNFHVGCSFRKTSFNRRRTVELTRRRESKDPSPHHVSYERLASNFVGCQAETTQPFCDSVFGRRQLFSRLHDDFLRMTAARLIAPT